MPVTQVAPKSFSRSGQSGISVRRAGSTISAPCPANRVRSIQAHGGTGLCGKKRWFRKAVSQHDCVTALRRDRYYNTVLLRLRRMNPGSLTRSSLYRLMERTISASQRSFGAFCVIWSCTQRKALKNNIRSACGTPVDSGRFRQAGKMRKNRCADKNCGFDC